MRISIRRTAGRKIGVAGFQSATTKFRIEVLQIETLAVFNLRKRSALTIFLFRRVCFWQYKTFLFTNCQLKTLTSNDFHNYMVQWWACDKSCGFVSGNFDEVSAHERFCQHNVQAVNAFPVQVSYAPAPQHIVVPAPPVPPQAPPPVDLWRSITTMEDYIRRQQVDLAKLWEENQALRQSLHALSWKNSQQESIIHALQSGASQSNTIRRTVQVNPQRAIHGDPAVGGRSVDRTSDTVNHLWI
jgi:hypothetical protein